MTAAMFLPAPLISKRERERERERETAHGMSDDPHVRSATQKVMRREEMSQGNNKTARMREKEICGITLLVDRFVGNRWFVSLKSNGVEIRYFKIYFLRLLNDIDS